jgi:hypothetical protein
MSSIARSRVVPERGAPRTKQIGKSFSPAVQTGSGCGKRSAYCSAASGVEGAAGNESRTYISQSCRTVRNATSSNAYPTNRRPTAIWTEKRLN